MHSEEVYSQLIRAADRDLLSARERLEHFLQQIAEATHPSGLEGDRKAVLPLRQWEIAQLIGVTPQWLSRLFHELEEVGTLRRQSEGFLLDIESLRRARTTRDR